MSGLRVTPYGEGATFVDLGIEGAPDRAARTHMLASALRRAQPDADVVAGAGTLAAAGVAAAEVARFLAEERALPDPTPPRTHAIPAVYDGPDLEAVAEALGMGVQDVIARHGEAVYVVELVGFLPGFAYLAAPAGWPLALPRRPSPRPRVPAGSVGIAGAFTGIYPFASPGGWNLVARAGATLLDPARDPPLLLAEGDCVRFVPSVELHSPPPPQPAALPPPGPGLVVLSAPACATVQDRGRPGQLGRGIPPSGPLDPEVFARANAAAGNAPGAAAVEVPLGTLEVEARGGVVMVSVDGEPAVRLAEGERLRVAEADRAVRYLAVRGGVDVPVVLGARATLLVAKLGGHEGRPLRKRDFLPAGRGEAVEQGTRLDPIAHDELLQVEPGPHAGRFPPGAYEALLAGPWRVSRLADRVGVRLEGTRVPREGPDLALPAPMIRGAIEITTDGTPIVLGPDHPTTGGYPVLAVLRARSQAVLARRRPGDPVRLVSV